MAAVAECGIPQILENFGIAAKFARAANRVPHLIVTDSKENIIYANSEFFNFTGFNTEEVYGRKCNMLQGSETSVEDVNQIRSGLKQRRRVCVSILNYTRNGSPFWNILAIQPLFREKKLVHFVGYILSLPIPEGLPQSQLCMDVAVSWMKCLASGPAPPLALQASDAEMVIEETSSGATLDERLQEKLQAIRATAGLLEDHSAEIQNEDSTSVCNLRFIAETLLPTHNGSFRMRAYRDIKTGAEPVTLIVGGVEDGAEIPVRVHDQCQTSEVLGSLRCDCKDQLDQALLSIQTTGLGMVVYMPQEGRGIGLANKIAAYAVQELGLDTVDANRKLGLPDDARQYAAVREILKDLRISSIKLMTNNPRKIDRLTKLGVNVTARVACMSPKDKLSKYSKRYIDAKAARMGHIIDADYTEGIAGNETVGKAAPVAGGALVDFIEGGVDKEIGRGGERRDEQGEAWKATEEDKPVAEIEAIAAEAIATEAIAAAAEQVEPAVRFADIESAVKVFAEGGVVVVMDDEGRENEGDLIMAASKCTAPQVAFFVRYSTGILCAPMTQARADELELTPMVARNGDINGTAFTVTCDAKDTTTGVSARDRMVTLHTLASRSCGAESINKPGHVFPLVAKDGGVLERDGHTESGVDLCRLALPDEEPVALIAELTNDDGTMKRLADCAAFAEEHDLPLITVEALQKYMRERHQA